MDLYIWDDIKSQYEARGAVESGFQNFLKESRDEEYAKIMCEAVSNNGDCVFALDGVLNIETYRKQQTRILFILKEAYDSTPRKNNGLYVWDELKWAQSNIKKMNNPTWRRIFLWSNLILNKCRKEKLCDKTKEEIIQKIAVINIKKVNGEKNSKDKALKGIVLKTADNILKQIKYFKPTIIICGHTGWLLDIALNNELRKVKNTEWIYQWNFNGQQARIVDFWHPSCIKSDKELLSKLDASLNGKLISEDNDDNTIK
jgi:hypothetical protein